MLELDEISYITSRNWLKTGTDNFSNKLKSRANKRLSKKKFIPEEYTKHTSIIELAIWFYEIWFTIEEILYSIILNLTQNVSNSFLSFELQTWNISKDRIIQKLLEIDIEWEWDILWWIYQSLLTEWEKNKRGSYYTPDYIVKHQIQSFFNDWKKIIDPCCWTWQYLINIPSSNPLNIWGVDLDVIAVRIARVNLMIKYKNVNFQPNVFHKDSLLIENETFNVDFLKENYFDIVATNPPWWAKIEKSYSWYSISSWETFSYFIERWLKLLKKWWILSYILPESILNVKTHEDIRKLILHYNLKSIFELWKIFTGVFTPVVRIDVIKESNDSNIYIFTKDKEYYIKKQLFLENSWLAFSIHIDEENNDILKKVYSKKNIFLNNENADWALWIVTWDNKKFISETMKEWYIPVYTWKEVLNYKLWMAKKYLLYNPKKYQQTASLDKYETSPKLIYKFISKRLVFSLDTEWVYTLNSANIIIPKIDYSLKVIVSLFNSELYQQIFQKKFNSIKVLKSHIQELPLPIFEINEIKVIEKLFDQVIKWEKNKKELDDYIFNLLIK